MKTIKKVLDKLTRYPVIGDIAKKIVRQAASNKVEDIAQHFSRFLSPEVAFTQDLRHEAFKIRHNVYCAELKFEPLKEDEMEVDDFDQHSLHCVMKHIPSNNYAGTVRIVRSRSEDEKLPIEAYCSKAISSDEVHPSDFPRESICEISRLAVPKEFRRRNADKFKGAETGAINESTYSETELRCFPFIAVGLYLSAANMIIHEGIEHCFVMMEPRLARSLSFVGIKFRQIGPVVEYHGQRAPYYISPQMLRESLPNGFSKLMENIDKELDEQFRQYH